MLHQELTEEIISAFYKVYNTLGYGFLESVYKNAMFFELLDSELECRTEQPVDVYYEQRMVGKFFVDILVENKVILELKSAECIREEHEAQLLNYLKATNIEIGLLLNFGKKPEFKRFIYSNNRK